MTRDLFITLVAEHRNIGQELLYFHMHVVVVVGSMVDNLLVVVVVVAVVGKQQVNHVEVMFDHLLLHMDYHDNLHKDHTH
jgi:hypothetical protein